MKIKSKWDVVKIGQLANTQYGFTDKAIDKGTTRYLRITDIKDDGSIYLDNEAKYISPTDEIKKQFLLKDKDIVIARSGSVGKSVFYKSKNYEEMVFASYLIRLIINTAKVLPEYLFNFTKTESYWNQVEVNSMAVTQPNLNAEKIKEFKIPLPPIKVQQKIVSEIEVLEQEEQKAIEKIEDLKSDVYKILNSFSENTVSKFCVISKEKENPHNNKDKNYNFISLEHIESNTGKITINKESGESILSTKNKFKKGDVLYGKLRPYLNKVAEPDFDGICSTDILVLNTSIPKLLKYALLSDRFVKQASNLMSGVSLPRVKVKDFLNLKISLPTADKQEKVVSEIEKLEKKITELEKQIAEIPRQKEAILKTYLE